MLQGGGEPAFQALLAATEAAAADWGAGAAAAALPAAATAALAEMEAATTSGVSVSVVGKAPAAAASKSKGKSPLRRLLEEAGWDGTAFSGPTFDAKALLSRLKTLQFDDLEEVGKGSYAVVYKARDRLTGDVISLKRLRADVAISSSSSSTTSSFDPGLPASAIREVSLLSQLDHPNIVKLRDVL